MFLVGQLVRAKPPDPSGTAQQGHLVQSVALAGSGGCCDSGRWAHFGVSEQAAFIGAVLKGGHVSPDP